jgi:hypothetical protein
MSKLEDVLYSASHATKCATTGMLETNSHVNITELKTKNIYLKIYVGPVRIYMFLSFSKKMNNMEVS